MMKYYVLIYHGSEVRAIRRSMADMVLFPDVLASVGFLSRSVEQARGSVEQSRCCELSSVAP